jgi:CRISPR system Cascade subunit CasA
LAYDQANPLAWRKESLSVPLELLESQEAVAFLKLAIERSNEAESLLYKAIARYLYECLPPGTTCGRDDVYHTQALDQFWSFLEAPFQAFLLALEKPDNGDNALHEWGQALRRTALEAFDRCVWQRYADKARTYQAWVQAKDSLAFKLGKLVNKGEG